MNRFAVMTVTGLLSATTYAGNSFAMETPASLDEQLAQITTTSFTIRNLNDMRPRDEADDGTAAYQNVDPSSPSVRKLQAAVASNETLARKLRREHVQIHNIVGAQKAADGGVTFYIR